MNGSPGKPSYDDFFSLIGQLCIQQLLSVPLSYSSAVRCAASYPQSLIRYLMTPLFATVILPANNQRTLLTDQIAQQTVPFRKVTNLLFETQLLPTSLATPSCRIPTLLLLVTGKRTAQAQLSTFKPVCAEKERDNVVEMLVTENDYAKIDDDVQTSDTHDGNAQPDIANTTQQVFIPSEENGPQQADEGRNSSQQITPSQIQGSTSSDKPKRNIVPPDRFKSFVTSFR